MTHPLTHRKYPAKFFDQETVDTLLLLVCAEASITWTPDKLDAAGDWALRTHLRASDNNTVRVPPMPDFIQWIPFDATQLAFTGEAA